MINVQHLQTKNKNAVYKCTYTILLGIMNTLDPGNTNMGRSPNYGINSNLFLYTND